jgi:hypothetical protein
MFKPTRAKQAVAWEEYDAYREILTKHPARRLGIPSEAEFFDRRI